MTWVWENAKASGTDLLVLLAIADNANDDGTDAWPSEATLADKTRVSTRTVRRCIRTLEADGAVVVEQHKGGFPDTRPDRRPNRYTIVMTGGQSVRADMERADIQGTNGRTSEVERADTRVRLTVLEPSKDPSLVAINRAKERYPQLDVDREVEQFRNHHLAKGSKMARWDSAFATWMGNAANWATGRRAGSGPRLSVGDRNVELLRGELA